MRRGLWSPSKAAVPGGMRGVWKLGGPFTFVPTVRSGDAHESGNASHQLLVRAGYVKQASSGIYAYLPAGYRAIDRLTRVIDDEMGQVGGERVSLPLLQPADLWKTSGRWDRTGPELMRLVDRKGASFCIAPTHEEMITSLVGSSGVASRGLPLRLYQIGPKYRDEARPRYGLLRAREFVMKDMYSFDETLDQARESYDAVVGAYQRLFARLDLPVVMADAATGNIGGSHSHEFHVRSAMGEDVLLQCDGCGRASNQEKTACVATAKTRVLPSSVRLDRSAARDVSQLAQQLHATGLPIFKLLQATKDGESVRLLYVGWCADGRGPNAAKLESGLKVQHVEEVDHTETAVSTLSSGDCSWSAVVVDQEMRVDLAQWGLPLLDPEHPELTRGELAYLEGDFGMALDGDACGVDGCKGHLRASKGVEIAHTFLLGQAYSRPFDARVQADGEHRLMEMGCYGIGVSRLLSVLVEHHGDDRGIRLPVEIAPYRVAVVSLAARQEDELDSVAVSLADRLDARGSPFRGDVVLENRRDKSPGFKLNEVSLLGVPWIVVVGRSYRDQGLLEVMNRLTNSSILVSPDMLENVLLTSSLE